MCIYIYMYNYIHTHTYVIIRNHTIRRQCLPMQKTNKRPAQFFLRWHKHVHLCVYLYMSGQITMIH